MPYQFCLDISAKTKLRALDLIVLFYLTKDILNILIVTNVDEFTLFNVLVIIRSKEYQMI